MKGRAGQRNSPFETHWVEGMMFTTVVRINDALEMDEVDGWAASMGGDCLGNSSQLPLDCMI